MKVDEIKAKGEEDVRIILAIGAIVVVAMLALTAYRVLTMQTYMSADCEIKNFEIIQLPAEVDSCPAIIQAENYTACLIPRDGKCKVTASGIPVWAFLRG